MLLRIQRFWQHDAGLVWLGVLFLLSLVVALPRVYATDEVQYYAWLRSVYFDHDVDFRNEYTTFARLNPHSGIAESLLQPNRIRETTGLYGNIAPVGSALLWAPWFTGADLILRGAHLIGIGQGIAADGYSWPYQRAIAYASAVYAWLGLLIVRRVSMHWVSQWSSTVATMTIWLATPLVFYMTVQMPFAHANGFFLSACFFWCWWRIQQPHQSWHLWAALGAIGGGMFLVREQLILFAVLPVMIILERLWRRWHHHDWSQLRTEITHWSIAVACAVVMLLPQIAAYQALNGTPMPANEVSGKLNLCSPHALDTLIDFDPRPTAWCGVTDEPVQIPAWSRGALVWSPVLIFALIGLAWFTRSHPWHGSAMMLAILLQVWINGAFGTTWHLSGAFGFRRLIECSPFFIVGLAYLVERSQARLPRWGIGAILALFIAWNMGLIINATVFNQSTQLRRGLSWPQLWQWQWELPGKLWLKGSEIFDRCRIIKNSC
jgi:hypothetical protein